MTSSEWGELYLQKVLEIIKVHLFEGPPLYCYTSPVMHVYCALMSHKERGMTCHTLEGLHFAIDDTSSCLIVAIKFSWR